MQRTVTVTGIGAASAVPDRAVVRVAVSHRAAGVAEAVAGLDPAGRAVSEVVRAHTEPGQVATTGVQVWPHHDQQGRPDGFEASHQTRIVCDDLASASALLSALAERVGDALRVDAVALEVGDPSEAVARARELAFADARARAEHLAGLGGAALGDLVAIQEGQAGPGQEGAQYARAAAQVSLEPGEQEVRVQVSGTWQLV
ncbi:SIMPL domain-containing protein [Nocardioides daphniae]|uniref:DUF541 domain-containing protein n=1 Tax=Nocardioides daphniae TaxID=402297 RepID=A0A4P7UBC3_9ACTN|nr:SIMPL domain-containing protein [Nocardioides daphniae]QCC77004.1 DUF541 domain-containing protein [Nocardioides daphniae]GGD18580.1 hypothetical protein GCM10007231_17130 [Nocardioides daphniae]